MFMHTSMSEDHPRLRPPPGRHFVHLRPSGRKPPQRPSPSGVGVADVFGPRLPPLAVHGCGGSRVKWAQSIVTWTAAAWLAIEVLVALTSPPPASQSDDRRRPHLDTATVVGSLFAPAIAAVRGAFYAGGGGGGWTTTTTTSPRCCRHTHAAIGSILLAAAAGALLVLATLTLAARCYAASSTTVLVQLPAAPRDSNRPHRHHSRQAFVSYSTASTHAPTSTIVLSSYETSSAAVGDPYRQQSDISVIHHHHHRHHQHPSSAPSAAQHQQRKRAATRAPSTRLKRNYLSDALNQPPIPAFNSTAFLANFYRLARTNNNSHRAGNSNAIVDASKQGVVVVPSSATAAPRDTSTRDDAVSAGDSTISSASVVHAQSTFRQLADNSTADSSNSGNSSNKSNSSNSNNSSSKLSASVVYADVDSNLKNSERAQSLQPVKKRPMPPGHSYNKDLLSESGGLLVLVAACLVLTLALGLVTCVLNHYRGGGTVADPPDVAQTPTTAPMLSVVSAGATAGVGGMDRLRGRGAARELAANRDHQVRLHAVHTDIAINLPPSISLPDGEEHPFSSRLHLRDTEQESEIYQKCIRPPPNRTVLESESPPPYRSSSAGMLGAFGGGVGGGGSCNNDWSSGGSAPPLVVRCHSMSTASLSSSSSLSSTSSTSSPATAAMATGPAASSNGAGASSGQKTDFIQKTVKIFTGKKSQPPPPAPTLPPVVIVPSRTRHPHPNHNHHLHHQPHQAQPQQQQLHPNNSSTTARPNNNHHPNV